MAIEGMSDKRILLRALTMAGSYPIRSNSAQTDINYITLVRSYIPRSYLLRLTILTFKFELICFKSKVLFSP